MMKLYAYYSANKFPAITFDGDELDTPILPALWIVHGDPNSCMPLQWRENCDKGGIVVFVSTSSYAGIHNGEQGARKLQQEVERCLCYPLGVSTENPNSQMIQKRFGMFIEAVRELDPGSAIPWDKLLPPTWPEHLVGLALLLAAMRHDSNPEMIVAEFEALEPAWREQFVGAARMEFHEREGHLTRWIAAGLPGEGCGPDWSMLSKSCSVAFDVLSSALPRKFRRS